MSSAINYTQRLIQSMYFIFILSSFNLASVYAFLLVLHFSSVKCSCLPFTAFLFYAFKGRLEPSIISGA